MIQNREFEKQLEEETANADKLYNRIKYVVIAILLTAGCYGIYLAYKL